MALIRFRGCRSNDVKFVQTFAQLIRANLPFAFHRVITPNWHNNIDQEIDESRDKLSLQSDSSSYYITYQIYTNLLITCIIITNRQYIIEY